MGVSRETIVLCIVGCLTTSLASTCWTPVTALPNLFHSPPCCDKKNYQMFAGEDVTFG